MKVLFVSGTEGDTRRYRCFHHQEQLALKGIASEMRTVSDVQLYLDVLEYDIFILHRVPHNELIQDVIELAHYQGKTVIFETDDLVFDPDLYPHIGYLDTLPVAEARRFLQELTLQAKTFRHCRAVLTTTESLAFEAGRRGKKAYVHRNAPNPEMIHISEQAYQKAKETEKSNREITIGYFSGTGSHDRDFRVVTPTLIAILEVHPGIRLHISGHLNLDPVFDPFAHRIHRAPYISWRELPYLIARVDINLAPLEMNNPFCQAKSEIKFLEAALVGVPTVATPVEAYRLAIVHGENGLLAATGEEWLSYLQLLCASAERRKSLGESARRTVYSQYGFEKMSSRLVAILQEISRFFHPVEPHGDGLILQVAQRMKKHCASALQEANLKHAGNLAEADRKRKKDLAETERYFHQSLRTILDRLKEKQTRRIESLRPSYPDKKGNL